MWKKYPLANNIVLSYNDDKHMYYVNDKKVESVTGICSRGVPKPQLINWLVATPLNEVRRLINEKLDNGEQLDRAILERIFATAKKKPDTFKDEGALVGSVVHGLIEDYLKGKNIPEQDKKGNLVLIDIKTSNHITFDYFLQLNAYRFAYEEETNQKISKAFVVRLPKKEIEVEIKEIPLNKKLFNAFVGAKYLMEQMESIEY